MITSNMKNITLIAALSASTLPLFCGGHSRHHAGHPNASRAGANNGRKVEKAPIFTRATADPVIGDWQGEGGLVAQVYRVPDGRYQANLLTAFDTASNVIVVLPGAAPGGAVTFSGDGWSLATVENSHFTGSEGRQEI